MLMGNKGESTVYFRYMNNDINGDYGYEDTTIV